jgi:uncharacterized protein
MAIIAEPAVRAAGPVEEARRLRAVDAARGFALLGIFLVNIRSFSEPLPLTMNPAPRERDLLSVICHYAVNGLCEGKFYVLFSMLFGIGLVLQMRNVRDRGGSFFAIYLLRLAALAGFGIVHALLLWYGDILLLYALVGTILMVLARYCSARVLLWIGIAAFALGIVMETGLNALTTLAHSPPAAAGSATPGPDERPSPAAPEGDNAGPKKPPFERLVDAFQAGHGEPGPTNTVWIEAETEAYRDGPFLQSFLFRLVTWLMFLVFETIFGFGFTVLGAFCFGAALMKWDFFAPSRRPWHRRLFAIGMLVAAPVCLAVAVVVGETSDPVRHEPPLLLVLGAGPLMAVAGLFLSLGYLSGLTLLATGPAARLAVPFAAAGRMALTNYLSQSLIATFVFYHWGLGQFGLWPLPGRIGLVFAVYAGQLVLSSVWMSYFRFGPMEWLWRTITYRRLQPMWRLDRAS